MSNAVSQRQKIKEGDGFIAALDQSGGSTPKALAAYGVNEDQYRSEAEMFDLVHQMRARIMTAPSFTGQHVVGAILFERTMDGEVEGLPTAQYLWERKQIVPFLKVDNGLAAHVDGVQLMKPIPELEGLLNHAVDKGIFGTKMRSVIHELNREGIRAVVAQQFEFGAQIIGKGLVPIIEPEVNIHAADKAEIEQVLLQELLAHLDDMAGGDVMLKLSIPTEPNLYRELMSHPRVLRVVALSGGYSRDEANQKLAANSGLIASFSRALLDGLSAQQSDAEFDQVLSESIRSIYAASVA